MTDITLNYKDGRADKIYRVWIVKEGAGFSVQTAYGRSGANPTVAPKTSAPVSLEDASIIAARVIREKTAKGYQPTVSAAAMTLPDAAEKTFIPPMLLNSVDRDQAKCMVTAGEWCAQPKYDGIRCQLHRTAGMKVTAYSRTGRVISIPKSVEQAMLEIEKKFPEVILDGELVEGLFIAFDVLRVEEDIRPQSLELRVNLLKLLVPDEGPLRRTPTAFTIPEKKAMMASLLKEGAEGIVFKERHSPYESGRPNSGGTGFKCKFVATATVKVLLQNETRSVDMVTRCGTNVGSVTIPPNKTVPPVGSLIEVRYLYTLRGGALVQAVYLGQRDDVTQADELSTLQYKNERRAS